MKRALNPWFLGGAMGLLFLLFGVVAEGFSGEGENKAAILQRVEAIQEEEATFVVIEADSPFGYTGFYVESPFGFVVEIPKMRVYPAQVGSQEFASEVLERVRVAPRSLNTEGCRVTLELKAGAVCRTFQNINSTKMLVRVENGRLGRLVAFTEGEGAPIASMPSALPIEEESFSGEKSWAFRLPLPESISASELPPTPPWPGEGIATLEPGVALPSRSEEGLVSADFVDAPLADVFESLAFQAGRHILVHSDVKGTVTLRLSQMPLEQAVDLIAAMYDLAVYRVDNAYVVAPKEKKGLFPPVVDMYQLRILSVEKASQVLSNIADVMVIPQDTDNRVILVGERGQVRRALEVLSMVDRVVSEPSVGPPEVEKVEFVVLKNAQVEEVIELVMAASPGVRVTGSPAARTIMIRGAESQVAAAVEHALRIDRLVAGVPAVAQTSRVFMVAQAPEEVAAALQTAIPGLTISVQPSLGAITVRGTAEEVDEAETLIQEITRGAPAVVEAAHTQAIKVQYVSAEALAAQLRELLSPQAQVTANPELSAVFVIGNKQDVEEAMAIAQVVDVEWKGGGPIGDGGIDIIVEELSYIEPAAAGEVLSAAMPDLVSTQPVTGTKKLIIRAPKGLRDEIKSLLKGVDVQPRMVEIEAMVADISKETSKTLGFSWEFGEIILREEPPAEGIRFGAFTREPWDVTGAISLIESDSESKLLARPRVTAVDGKTSEILTGDKVYYPVTYVQAGAVVTEVREESAGIKLTITPRITKDGYIMADVGAEASIITGFSPQGYPMISTRETNVTALLADGQTLVIGGLIREEEVEAMSRVPLLGDLPFLGQLFRRHTVSKRPSEVLMFITPRILDIRAEREEIL